MFNKLNKSNDNKKFLLNKVISEPHKLPEKAGSYLKLKLINTVEKTLNYIERFEYFLNLGKDYSSGCSKILILRPKYQNNLISESKFLIEGTLREFIKSNKKFTYDQYLWDQMYSLMYSTDRSFIKTLINGKYEYVILNSWEPAKPWHPSINAIKFLKKKMFVKIIAIWYDTEKSKFFNDIKDIITLVDKHIIADNPRLNLGSQIKNLDEQIKSKFIPVCFPRPKNFFDVKKEKNINLLFIGRTKDYRSYRTNYLKYLMVNNIPIFNLSLEREYQINWNEYRDLISRSKMVLNFSMSYSQNQLKGRALEALWAKSLLLESQNNQITKYFQDGKEFVSFKNEKDLKDKIIYFTKNQKELEEIANNGYEKITKKYDSNYFGGKILDDNKFS